RWSGLTCLNSLDVRLWAGLPFEDGSDGTTKLIPPVLDEWEVGAIMRGLSDLDGTIRNLTMDLLYKVDPQLVHAFLEQLLTPPPTATAPTPQPKPVEALEVLSFLYPKDGASFARGVSKIVNITARREQGDGKKSAPAVNDKLVEGVILTVHEGDQAFRSAFVDALLESIERDMDTSSLISPLTPAAAGPSTNLCKLSLSGASGSHDYPALRNNGYRLSKPRRGWYSEVLLLAALRLLPRLERLIPRRQGKCRGIYKDTMGRHMRRRCELFTQFAEDIQDLLKLVDETRDKSLPEFLQALLSHKPPSTSTPEVQSSLSSPKASTLRKVASPSPAVGRTISPIYPSANSAYSQSPFRRESEIRSSSSDSIVSSDLDAAAARRTPDTSSPPFHTAVTASPTHGQDGGDLAPSDADAIWNSFDSADADSSSSLGKQTLRGWCDRTPETVGNALRAIEVGFVTQKVGPKPGHASKEKEVLAFIPAPADSPDTDVARAVVRLKPADDGSCLWMLRVQLLELFGNRR
ncbi:ARM repeat-containing protein, partial [Rhizoctonia solani]